MHNKVRACLCVGQRASPQVQLSAEEGQLGNSCRRPRPGLLTHLYRRPPHGNGLGDPRILQQKDRSASCWESLLRALPWWVLQTRDLGGGLCCSYTLFPITRVTVAQCRKLGNHRRGQRGRGKKHGVVGISATFQPNNIHALVLCTNHLFAFIKSDWFQKLPLKDEWWYI